MTPALRFQRIVVKIIMLIAVPICVGGLIAAGIGFAEVWRTSDWQHLWDALSHFARFAWLVVLLPNLSGWLSLPQMRDALPAPERAAISGDALLATAPAVATAYGLVQPCESSQRICHQLRSVASEACRYRRANLSVLRCQASCILLVPQLTTCLLDLLP